MKNAPGIQSVVPYTISAAIRCMSSFRDDRIPSKTSGNASIHELERVFRAVFSCRWKRSAVLFAWGWYDVVRTRFEPRKVISDCQRVDSNCHPRSVMIMDGMPKRAIHPLTKVCATVSAVIDDSGKASGHLVKRSTHVRR